MMYGTAKVELDSEEALAERAELSNTGRVTLNLWLPQIPDKKDKETSD
jgi:hypothetical protein